MTDINRLKNNCASVLHKKYADHSQVKNHLASQSPDGSWKDIDYQDQNRSNWAPAKHLLRLRLMAAAWSDPASKLYHNAALGNGIKNGITFWSKEKRICINWWWNEIFVPITSGHIFIFAFDLFADDEAQWRDKIMPSLLQAKFNYTGQNRMWCAEGVLLRGILTKDQALISAARKEITAEIVYGKKEGIRVDGSFHQHGPQLQFGNYGMSYLESVTCLITYFSGTRWALTKIEPFRDFVINGMKWVLWKQVMDISAMGRQIAMDQQTKKNKFIRSVITDLIKSDPDFAAAYKKEPHGNKMFFTSDFMVHRMKNFYASFRANSVRTSVVETYINSDNLLGRYLSDGLLQVMRSGEEYLNIAGCWSWTRLPGTTTPDTPRFTVEESRENGVIVNGKPPYVTHDVKIRYNGESTFTGGVSDGKKYGVMISTMDLDKVKANKAVFFAGDIIIALGSGIESDSPYPVATTVEQSLHCGEIRSGDGWFYHNGIGYSGKNMTLTTGKRKGDWQPTWGGYTQSVPDEKDIFQLTIDHGTGIRGGTYEYAIYPDTTAEKMPDMMQSYEILENSEKLQAVKLKDNTIMAIFHKPGEIAGFTTDSPGVFIIGKKQIFAADPTHKKRIFNLTSDGKKYKLTLPGGVIAGSTVCLEK